MSTLSRVRCASRLWMVSLGIAAGGAVFAGEPSSNAPVTVDTFQAADGQTYGAVIIRPDLTEASARPRDVVVLMDTSASQTGSFRSASLELVHGLVAALAPDDRVLLMALDVAPQALVRELMPARSAAVEAELKWLEARAPLGTCDIRAGLVAAARAFEPESGRERVIVCIGDGENTAGVVTRDSISALLHRLRDERIVVQALGVGRAVNEAFLGRLTSETGGRSTVVGPESRTADVLAALAEWLRAPVLYPDSLRLSGALPLLPQPAPPLRADQGTLFITRGSIPSPMTVSVAGECNGRPLERAWSVTPQASSPDNSYLANLWSQWQRNNAAAPGEARANLALAKADHSEMISNLLVLGEVAAARGMASEAEAFLQKALEHDPGNLQAKSLLRTLGQQTRERAQAPAQDAAPPAAAAPSGEAPRQVPPPPPAAPPAQELAPPAQDSARPRPARPAAPEVETPEPRATIGTARELEGIATERLSTEVSVELSDARKMMSREPERAIDLLKTITLPRVDAAMDVPEADRIALRRRVESLLRQATAEKQRLDLEAVERAQNRAKAEQIRQFNNALMQQQQRLDQILEQFSTLMAERHFREGLAVARRARDISPDAPLSEAATLIAEFSSNLDDQLELNEVRKHRLLLTLLQVDKSHIPFPDEPPIEYPDSTWWEEMSKRRIEKYATVDLARPSKAEAEINRKLKEPVSVEFVETPLSDVIDFLRDLTHVNIVLDKVALEEEGVTSDTPVTIHVEQISLKSALRLLLGQLNLTYLIKDDVLRITSQLQAGNELLTKVYPVADLVIPVSAGGGLGGGLGGLGGGGGGGGGGLGGGGGGGLGGGGGGGLGGGGGGLGGFGFRNVPNGPAPRAGAGGGGAGGNGQNNGDMSDQLIELIEDVVAPDSWDARGGAGSARPFRPNASLIIHQTSEVHGDLSDTLGQLRGGVRAEKKQSSSAGLPNLNP